MQRPLCSFPLSSGQQARLKVAGFETTADLRDVGVVELSKGRQYTCFVALNKEHQIIIHTFPYNYRAKHFAHSSAGDSKGY